MIVTPGLLIYSDIIRTGALESKKLLYSCLNFLCYVFFTCQSNGGRDLQSRGRDELHP